MKKSPIGRRSFLELMGSFMGGACLGGLFGCTSKQNSDETGSDDLLSSDPVSNTIFVFDTVVTLSAYCTEDVLKKAVDRCYFFENTFSRTLEGSDVWNINHAKGEPVEVERETYDVIAKALEYAKASDGLFDITIGAVSELWDFDEGIKPSDEAIAEALPHVDYTALILDDVGCRVGLSDPLARIDLGGIAKGYIADDLAGLFMEEGCKSALINLGGNVMCVGTKPDGTPWNIGIQDPNDASSASIIASVQISDATVVTSGLYERYFIDDGVNYYHILDPNTGYPVLTDLLSSSIVTLSSTEADVWATVLFMQGSNRALETLNSREDFEGLLVNDAGDILVSDTSPFELV